MDADADGRWMTYEELADARGIDRQSARRLASRLKWRRQKDNRQTVRVYVPSNTQPPREKRDKSADISADMPAVMSADMSIVIKPLEAAVAALQDQLARANAVGDDLRAQLVAVRAELDKARADEVDQRSRADRAEGVIEGLKAAQASPAGGFAAWWQSVRAAFRS